MTCITLVDSRKAWTGAYRQTSPWGSEPGDVRNWPSPYARRGVPLLGGPAIFSQDTERRVRSLGGAAERQCAGSSL